MEYIQIGTIINTHGLKGEVKIRSASDFDEERYQIGNTVYIRIGLEYRPFVVASFRVHKGYSLVSFEGYQDINLVECFKTFGIYMNAADRHELEEGEYYVDDLIGMKVITTEGALIGTVIRIEDTNGAQNNLRVQRSDSSTVLIPYVDEFVTEVNEDTKTITIQVMEGLL